MSVAGNEVVGVASTDEDCEDWAPAGSRLFTAIEKQLVEYHEIYCIAFN